MINFLIAFLFGVFVGSWLFDLTIYITRRNKD